MHKVGVFFTQEFNYILSQIYNGFHVKYKLFLSDLMKFELSRQVFEKKKMQKYQTSIKSVQWEPSCSMWTDRQTEMSKPIIAIRYFANATKNDTVCARHNFAGNERTTIRLTLQLCSLRVCILILLTIHKHKITQDIHTKFTDKSDIIVGSRKSTSSRKLNRFMISRLNSTSSRYDAH